MQVTPFNSLVSSHCPESFIRRRVKISSGHIYVHIYIQPLLLYKYFALSIFSQQSSSQLRKQLRDVESNTKTLQFKKVIIQLRKLQLQYIYFFLFLAGWSVLTTPLCPCRPFCSFRYVWIRTQRAAVASRRATNLATHLPPISLQPHISLLATHLPNLATCLPNQPPISLISHPSH